ncbi:hypothetical protein [Sediminibacterium sp.]|uniref:hypothetical protein n=1 Tax=Sediminibacterium sp. TaxID=1917865 RepID=UPI0025D12570|nr:hypothetical protein [Sediminibacterium sp.]
MKIPALLFRDVAKDFDEIIAKTAEKFQKEGISDEVIKKAMDEDYTEKPLRIIMSYLSKHQWKVMLQII